jgi:hypothetical protein
MRRAPSCHADPCVRGATVIVHWPPPAGVQQREQHELTEVVIPRPDTDPAEYATEIAEALSHADLVISDAMALVLEAAARARPLVALIGGDSDQELARFCSEVGQQRGWPRVAHSLDALDHAGGQWASRWTGSGRPGRRAHDRETARTRPVARLSSARAIVYVDSRSTRRATHGAVVGPLVSHRLSAAGELGRRAR